MKTTTLTPKDITRKWHLIDLSGKVLGRSAVEIAQLLAGKGKVLSGDHLDNGDFVVAINSKKFIVTGKKLTDKMYYSHSGFAGGFKEANLQQMIDKDSRRVIEKAVKGMLPKDKHQQNRLRRLKIFKSDKHQYSNELGLNKKAE
ncbi:MAG: 50S ribosomal protein L13 [uncultured bacterium]|nr:MAG: 50S ribosomal protein L13 [uncultured bacterium]